MNRTISPNLDDYKILPGAVLDIEDGEANRILVIHWTSKRASSLL